MEEARRWPDAAPRCIASSDSVQGLPDRRERRVILTERSEVDGESRRKPAVTIRAGVRGVGSNPLVVAVGQAASAAGLCPGCRFGLRALSATWGSAALGPGCTAARLRAGPGFRRKRKPRVRRRRSPRVLLIRDCGSGAGVSCGSSSWRWLSGKDSDATTNSPCLGTGLRPGKSCPAGQAIA